MEKKKACFEMRKCCWRLCSDVCRQAVALQRPLVFGMTKTATSGGTASGLKKKNCHGAIQLNGVLSPHRRLLGSSCLEGASRLPPSEPIIEQRLLQACQFREDVGLNLRFEQATM